MNIEETRGRKKIVAIITTIMAIPIMVVLISLNSQGNFEIAISGTRIIITAILCYFLYQGKYLAKRITAILTTLTAISCFFVAFMAYPAPRLTISMLLLFAISGTISYQLIRSEDISTYFEYMNTDHSN